MNKCVNIKNKNKTFVHPSEEKKLKHIKDIVWIYKTSTNWVRIGFSEKALTQFQNKSFLPFFL